MQASSAQNNGEKLIVGLGRTGLSCARYFHARGERFRAMDSRFSPPELARFRRDFPDVEVDLGGFSLPVLLAASEIVLSPGISLKTPEIAEAVAQGVPVVGDIDIFSRAVDKPIIAVTGSNGKSTVVTLLGEMAREAGLAVGVGGNLDGRASMPALDLLRVGVYELYVLELSSFQLETTSNLAAEVAVLLNVAEDHLDRYESMEAYRAAKHRIFSACRNAVVNRDDPDSLPRLPEGVPCFSFGLDEPADKDFGLRYLNGDAWLCRGGDNIISVRELRLIGAHNRANVLAALAVGTILGFPREAITATLREFGGLPHRCQWLRDCGGVAFYNDSKGTNVAATSEAVKCVASVTSGKVVLIAGGVDKDADFEPLSQVLKEHVSRVVLIGRDADRLARTFGNLVPVALADDMGDAVKQAYAEASAGDAVLLSPACASFDMYRDFADRGRAFSAVVEALE